jgi:hypothetical protein
MSHYPNATMPLDVLAQPVYVRHATPKTPCNASRAISSSLCARSLHHFIVLDVVMSVVPSRYRCLLKPYFLTQATESITNATNDTRRLLDRLVR